VRWWASGAQQATDGLSGLTGVAADVVVAAGEVGVGALAALETVFPPIPSEVVLPLAGYLAERGRMTVVGVLVAAVVGAVVGNLVLYALGRSLGEERAGRLLCRLPLMSTDDVQEASAWFSRHGRRAVFFGRWVPVVRALVSLPAGAQRMPLPTFVVYTAAGIGSWNSLLVTAGYLLGTQYQLLQDYLGYLDYVFLAALVVLVGLWVRRHRRRSAAARVG
jgi:membrane protein DedA with SNARE-associated domain